MLPEADICLSKVIVSAIIIFVGIFCCQQGSIFAQPDNTRGPRLDGNDVPYSFQGMPIVLITACLMAIAFFGFSGLKM